MSLKNIRAKTVGAKKNFNRIELDFDGDKVYFRQPSRKEVREIQKFASKDGDFDFTTFQLYSVIKLTEDADGTRVFSDEDFDSMINEPTGGWLDSFQEKALEVMSPTDPKPESENSDKISKP